MSPTNLLSSQTAVWYEDNRPNSLNPQVPKYQTSPTQKTAGKAARKGLDQYLATRSIHPEGENTLPEHLKSFLSGRETVDRESQAAKNTKTTGSLEHFFKSKHTNKNKQKLLDSILDNTGSH